MAVVFVLDSELVLELQSEGSIYSQKQHTQRKIQESMVMTKSRKYVTTGDIKGHILKRRNLCTVYSTYDAINSIALFI